MINKNIIVIVLSIFLSLPVIAQTHGPVQWKFESKNVGEGKVVLMLTAQIEPEWHVYSQFIAEGGPMPTTFNFTKTNDFELIGKVKEQGELIEGWDQAFGMNIAWFEREVIFYQVIKLNKIPCIVSGTVEYMGCNEMQCLPPREVEFKISVEKKFPPKRKF